MEVMYFFHYIIYGMHIISAALSPLWGIQGIVSLFLILSLVKDVFMVLAQDVKCLTPCLTKEVPK